MRTACVVLFNDEVDLLRFRTQYLIPRIDLHVVVECRFTFAATPKPLRGYSLSKSFRGAGVHLESLEITLPSRVRDSGDRWLIEEFIRDEALRWVRTNMPNTLIFFSDVDEIPSLEQVEEAQAHITPGEVATFRTPVYFRRANWLLSAARKLHRGKVFWSDTAVPGLRYAEAKYLRAEDGAHYSYLGMDSAAISRKYQSFSHSEFDSPGNADPIFIAFCDEYRISHTGSHSPPTLGLLKVLRPPQLGSVGAAALQHHPSWFDFHPAAGFLSRLSASIKVQNYLDGKIDLYQLSEQDWKDGLVAAGLWSQYVGRASRHKVRLRAKGLLGHNLFRQAQ